MRVIIVCFVVTLVAAAAVAACGRETCGAQDDCPVGFYCVLSFSGGRAEGTCEQDCASSGDCEQPQSTASRAVCTNDGRCRVEARPPRLIVLEPEPGAIYEEGTRRIRIVGELEMGVPQAVVKLTTVGSRGCGSGETRQTVVENDTGGYAAVPFALEDVQVDPFETDLQIEAEVPGFTETYPVDIQVACPGCAQLTIADPRPNATGDGLRLPVLRGNVLNSVIESAVWRVRGVGGVLDGVLPFAPNGQDFAATDLPLFAGSNRVEVVVTGVGLGQGESRCSVRVNAGVSAEAGLRAILTWNGPTADLDLHLIGDGGQYGDPLTTLSSRSRSPLAFSGDVVDDFDGFGPEVLTAVSLPDGTYGLIVEAVFDDEDPGSTALLRVLYDGQTLTSGPIGPQYLQAIRGDLWVAGVLVVSGGQAAFEPINGRAQASMPPTTAPSMWPALF